MAQATRNERLGLILAQFDAGGRRDAQLAFCEPKGLLD